MQTDIIGVFVFAYAITMLADGFYFFELPMIAILYMLGAFLICIQVLRENIIEKNNTMFMIFLSIIIAAIVILGVYALTYKDEVKKLDKKEMVGQTAYSEDSLKKISELGITDLYINVKQEGKWGYINQKGEKVIDFKYDYASPFIKINKFDKEFWVALVCIDGNGKIILQNERTIYSYKNQIDVNDYEMQLEKLEDIYINVLEQTGDFSESIISCETENISKIAVSEQKKYTYPYNDDYDIYIKVSQTGSKNRYELKKKTGNTNVNISIDCDDLEFDENYLYVFKNGYLPFYKRSSMIQGYYDSNMKRTEMNGNAQILEFYDNNMLIKDYNEDSIYFMSTNGDVVSEKYKDIYVWKNGYIVKKQNGKYTLIDKKFKQTIDKEYDYINPKLIDEGLLICANLPADIALNDYDIPENIMYVLMTLDGKVISEEFSGIYDIVNANIYSNDSNYIKALTDIEYNFIGERFYTEDD